MFWLMWKDTLPEDPWLDEPELPQDESALSTPAAQAAAPVKTTFKPQSTNPHAIYDKGSVSSGLTQAPFDPTGQIQGSFRPKTNWRGTPELDDEAETYARFGLIVGVILGVGLIAAIVWFVTRRNRKS